MLELKLDLREKLYLIIFASIVFAFILSYPPNALAITDQFEKITVTQLMIR